MAKGGIRSTSFTKDDNRASEAGKKSSKHVPEELRNAREVNAKAFEASLYKYMKMNLPDLKVAFKNPYTCGRDLAVIKILMKAIQQGDYRCLDFLLERTIGKVKQNVEVSGELKVKSITESLEGSESQAMIDVTPDE